MCAICKDSIQLLDTDTGWCYAYSMTYSNDSEEQMVFRVTLRFEGDNPWIEIHKIHAESLAAADNFAVKMQDERDADAVFVERMYSA